MQPTSTSLLNLLKQGEEDDAWARMLTIYQPLIKKWLVRFGAPANDLADLSQNVLSVILKKLPKFEHAGRAGSFRAWIREITRNCLLKFWREKRLEPIANGKVDFQDRLNQLADESSELSQCWNQEYDEHVLASVLRQIQGEFQTKTWLAFQKVTLDGKSASVAAEELGVTINSVFIAKSRVMTRLREAGKDLLEFHGK